MAEDTSTVLQGQYLPAYQEKFLKDLLASTSKLGSQGGPYIPAYESYIAGMAPAQQRAIQMGLSGVGSYMPMMQAGSDTLGQGIGGYQQGMNYALSGVPLFQQSARDTQSSLAGASPFQRQAQQAMQQARAGATRFGNQAAGIGRGAGNQLAMLGGQAAGIGRGAAGDIMSATQAAMPFQNMAANRLGRSTKSYDPSSVSKFMDPYTDEVIRRAEADISRQGQQQAQDIRARAVGAGAFGGSREAVSQRELGRNVGEQQARTSSQLRSQGYQQAQNQAQTAFESQQRRQQQAGQLFGQLGTSYGQLGQSGAQAAGQMGLAGLGQQIGARQAGAQLGLQGTQQGMAGQQLAGQMGQGLGSLGTSYGQLGLQGAQQLGGLGAQYGALGTGLGGLAGGLGKLGLSQAALGESLQGAQQRDINALMGLGGMEQGYNQRLLDAQRRTMFEREMAPYQALGYMSDIFRGVPSTTSSLTSTSAPSANIYSQIGGLGMGLAGLSQSDLFSSLFGGGQ